MLVYRCMHMPWHMLAARVYRFNSSSAVLDEALPREGGACQHLSTNRTWPLPKGSPSNLPLVICMSDSYLPRATYCSSSEAGRGSYQVPLVARTDGSCIILQNLHRGGKGGGLRPFSLLQ